MAPKLATKGDHRAHHLSDAFGLLKDYWALAVALAVATATFLSSLDHIKSQLLSGPLQGFLAIAVLAASIFWLIDYLNATRNDLDLFERYQILDEAPIAPWQAIVLVTILSVSLGSLIASIPYPVIYCSIAVAIQIADCIGLAIIQRLIFLAYKNAPELNPVIKEFHLYAPQFMHRIAKLVGFMAALLFAVVGNLKKDPRFTTLAWILVLITIVGGEAVLAFWRHSLHLKLSLWADDHPNAGLSEDREHHKFPRAAGKKRPA